jgi:hypothetical protein
MARRSHTGHVDSRAGERYRLLVPAYTYVRSNDHMVTPAKFMIAIIACLLMLGLIFGMAFIPDDTHKFF